MNPRNIFRVGDVVTRYRHYNHHWISFVTQLPVNSANPVNGASSFTVTEVGGNNGDYIRLEGSLIWMFYQNFHKVNTPHKPAVVEEDAPEVVSRVDYVLEIRIVGVVDKSPTNSDYLLTYHTKKEMMAHMAKHLQFKSKDYVMNTYKRICFESGAQAMVPYGKVKTA